MRQSVLLIKLDAFDDLVIVYDLEFIFSLPEMVDVQINLITGHVLKLTFISFFLHGYMKVFV